MFVKKFRPVQKNIKIFIKKNTKHNRKKDHYKYSNNLLLHSFQRIE